MRRLAIFLCSVALAFSIGCSGSSSSSTPTSVTLSPSPLSIVFGQADSKTTQLSATVENSTGTVLTTATVTYTSSNSALASVSTNGLVCGGTWDSLTNPVVCKPATTAPGTATITATATVTGRGSATGSVTVYVHSNVDTVLVTPASSSPPCTSQGGTATYTAIACSLSAAGSPGGCPQGNNITSDVGTATWTVTPSTVATASGTCGASCQIIAGAPGQAVVSATIASTVSTATTFTTCPVQSISLHNSSDSTVTSSTLSVGNTTNLSAVVLDSMGNTLTAQPTLTYSSSQPASVVGGTTTTAEAVAGTGTIVASCTPPSCNSGLYPVFSNPYVVTVSGSSSTPVVYAASLSSTSLVPISGTSVQTAVTLPYMPNSMLINATGAEVILGSKSGVMVYNTSSGAIITLSFNNQPLSGRILAISPDGNIAIFFSGPNEGNTGTALAYVYNIGTNSVVASIPLVNATRVSAAFSPDSSEAFMVTDNDLVKVWSTTISPQNVSATSAVNDVAFLGEGSFAYVAGGNGGNVSVYASCNPTLSAGPSGVATPGVPTLIRAVPNGTQLVAADSPNVDLITATPNNAWGVNFIGTSFLSGLSCTTPPLITNSTVSAPISSATYPGGFTATQLMVTPDSSQAVILASTPPAVLVSNISGNNLTTPTVITFSSGVKPLSGAVTLDSVYLYVGASDNQVHQINFNGFGDTLISPGITPDFVAVRP